MWLLPLAIVMLASSTIYVVFSLEIAVNYTNPLFDYDKSFTSLEDISGMGETLFYLPSVNVGNRFLRPLIFSQLFQYMFSDTILFWRAYVLWTHDRRVFILPAFLLAGSLGMSIVPFIPRRRLHPNLY